MTLALNRVRVVLVIITYDSRCRDMRPGLIFSRLLFLLAAYLKLKTSGIFS